MIERRKMRLNGESRRQKSRLRVEKKIQLRLLVSNFNKNEKTRKNSTWKTEK